VQRHKQRSGSEDRAGKGAQAGRCWRRHSVARNAAVAGFAWARHEPVRHKCVMHDSPIPCQPHARARHVQDCFFGVQQDVLNWDGGALACSGSCRSSAPPPCSSHLPATTCAAAAGNQLFLRVERETLTRMPATQAILFTIRTYITPLQQV